MKLLMRPLQSFPWHAYTFDWFHALQSDGRTGGPEDGRRGRTTKHAKTYWASSFSCSVACAGQGLGVAMSLRAHRWDPRPRHNRMRENAQVDLTCEFWRKGQQRSFASSASLRFLPSLRCRSKRTSVRSGSCFSELSWDVAAPKSGAMNSPTRIPNSHGFHSDDTLRKIGDSLSRAEAGICGWQPRLHRGAAAVRPRAGLDSKHGRQALAAARRRKAALQA